jgi:Transposase domain (DUF772)
LGDKMFAGFPERVSSKCSRPVSGEGFARRDISSDTRIAGIGPAAVRRACACSSERRLCEAVHLILAYCWFCRLGLEGKVADHATFLKNRHGRFRDSDASAIPSAVPLENIRWPS